MRPEVTGQIAVGVSGLEKEQPKNQINLNPFKRLFENPQRSLEPYVKKGQVTADLGCNKGYYTFALADCVGPDGKVYAVDLKREYIDALSEKGDKLGYHNIEWHAASASNMDFIGNESVDFVLANGLLCNVPDHRQAVVNEIQRILKPPGQAYLSLGGISPFFGFVGRKEWGQILEKFIVKRKGGLIQKWAAVSKRENDQYASKDYVEPAKSPRLLKLRKKLGES